MPGASIPHSGSWPPSIHILHPFPFSSSTIQPGPGTPSAPLTAEQPMQLGRARLILAQRHRRIQAGRSCFLVHSHCAIYTPVTYLQITIYTCLLF
ncbi:hypothetical protein D4764_09G0009560 [Takifugu flavidus]|uniref:Uncharacterized protein n=1 Tax=Takifugu flavidus TaxID=433684 RepID=A0A5C6ML76_9TELE|nr:hypothetical protein D4764_09G0009560 [Takifugu flavidus]